MKLGKTYFVFQCLSFLCRSTRQNFIKNVTSMKTNLTNDHRKLYNKKLSHFWECLLAPSLFNAPVRETPYRHEKYDYTYMFSRFVTVHEWDGHTDKGTKMPVRHRRNLWWYEGTGTPTFWTDGYRTPICCNQLPSTEAICGIGTPTATL